MTADHDQDRCDARVEGLPSGERRCQLVRGHFGYHTAATPDTEDEAPRVRWTA